MTITPLSSEQIEHYGATVARQLRFYDHVRNRLGQMGIPPDDELVVAVEQARVKVQAVAIKLSEVKPAEPTPRTVGERSRRTNAKGRSSRQRKRLTRRLRMAAWAVAAAVVLTCAAYAAISYFGDGSFAVPNIQLGGD